MNSYNDEHLIWIGSYVQGIGLESKLPIAVEVRLGNWIVFHASLPGSSPENDNWISRKAKVVDLKHHSTLFERVYSQERCVDWFQENNVLEETHTIHGGGFPLNIKDKGYIGSLLISGLPHLEDHALCVEALTALKRSIGE
jgi:uncharacterized protein (UPF0303 family)